jgi:hypothetical protein
MGHSIKEIQDWVLRHEDNWEDHLISYPKWHHPANKKLWGTGASGIFFRKKRVVVVVEKGIIHNTSAAAILYVYPKDHRERRDRLFFEKLYCLQGRKIKKEDLWYKLIQRKERHTKD